MASVDRRMGWEIDDGARVFTALPLLTQGGDRSLPVFGPRRCFSSGVEVGDLGSILTFEVRFSGIFHCPLLAMVAAEKGHGVAAVGKMQ